LADRIGTDFIRIAASSMRRATGATGFGHTHGVAMSVANIEQVRTQLQS
jgi:hypothetical protein